MSLFCFFAISSISEDNKVLLNNPYLEKNAQFYHIELNTSVGWSEPILTCVDKKSVLLNISDENTTNCELFLLPDGWYYNGKTNNIRFRDRMFLLQTISSFFTALKKDTNLYIGESGTNAEDYLTISLHYEMVADFLNSTIGQHGVMGGLHVIILPHK
ncbi:MAG: hypothetical protein IJU75_02490 [Clostridia bacterium]|nr:hypothetical protein [Clostridia bacterium]